MSPDRQARTRSGRALALAGGLTFGASLAVALVQYVGPWGAVTSAGSLGAAAWNSWLFTLFAFHHSLFARTPVKNWIASWVSPSLERSVYVWIASVLFLIVCLAWQPVAGAVWRVDGALAAALESVQVAGVVLTLVASRQLDILALAGVRQAWATSPQARQPDPLVENGLYRLVRHPIYFAWVLMVWPTPVMTGTRLVFATVSTLYLALAIPLEERTLRRTFGPAYDGYAKRVKWRMVPFLY